MKTLRHIAIAAAFVGTAAVAYSQEMTTDELKSKGATVVAEDDLAALLKGANVHRSTGSDLYFVIKETPGLVHKKSEPLEARFFTGWP